MRRLELWRLQRTDLGNRLATTLSGSPISETASTAEWETINGSVDGVSPQGERSPSAREAHPEPSIESSVNEDRLISGAYHPFPAPVFASGTHCELPARTAGPEALYKLPANTFVTRSNPNTQANTVVDGTYPKPTTHTVVAGADPKVNADAFVPGAHLGPGAAFPDFGFMPYQGTAVDMLPSEAANIFKIRPVGDASYSHNPELSANRLPEIEAITPTLGDTPTLCQTASSNAETIKVLLQWIDALKETLSEQHQESGCQICYGDVSSTESSGKLNILRLLIMSDTPLPITDSA